MPDIYSYLDYRDFLREAYEERRKVQPIFSYRYIGNKVGMDNSYLTRLFQKKVHIGTAAIAKMASIYALTAAQEEFFNCLIGFNKARTEAEARTFHDQLLRLRGVGYRTVHEEQQVYFSRWIHVALRCLVGFQAFDGDYDRLGSLLVPSVPGDEVKQSLFLLERLGMIRRNLDGFEVLDTHLHSGNEWTSNAILGFQKESIALAADALVNQHSSVRDISTMTMDINLASLGEVRTLVREFQENMARIVDSSGPSNCVYQLNVQLFPLSKIIETKT
jgi:uncharacterized protein (TIGR02147 family)